ncbi:MAG TPA: TSUP family transporter [bacterium]|nr:TSUP family transporter [bacterium]
MEYLIVAVASFAVSALTLYSGFGLGTLLMPVFALFFPVDAAVAATAVVHGANSLFKVAVVGREADRSLIIRFGIPAIFAAFAGAAALGLMANLGSIASYRIGSHAALVTPLKLVMGLLMVAFAAFELAPPLRKLEFSRKYLVLGGILSGFFGGLSGHQGALRSAFLAKVGISTGAFVGTNAAIGFMVDLARIATYSFLFLGGGIGASLEGSAWPLVVTGIGCAFAGVLSGRRFLHRVTMESVQLLTGVMLAAIAIALAAGII